MDPPNDDLLSLDVAGFNDFVASGAGRKRKISRIF